MSRFPHSPLSTAQLLSCLAVLAYFLSSPDVAHADGGGPLLLIANIPIFVLGQVWILGSETVVWRELLKAPWKNGLSSVLVMNLYSTLVIGFGFPIVLAAISLPGGLLPGPADEISFALGTWVYERTPYAKLAIGATVCWFVVTYFLTVSFESWLVAKRWRMKGITPAVSAGRVSWLANTASYVGLSVVIAVLLFWDRVF